METKALRLELLKLAYTHGREAREAVARAEELEKYVLDGDTSAKVATPNEKKAPLHLQKNKRGNS